MKYGTVFLQNNDPNVFSEGYEIGNLRDIKVFDDKLTDKQRRGV